MTTREFRVATHVMQLVLLSFLSPLAGFALEVLLARTYGDSTLMDAFRITSLILLLGLNLFFTQLLPHVVVPAFSNFRVRYGEKQVWEILLSLSNFTGYLGVGCLLAVYLYPVPVLQLLGPGLPALIREDAIILIYCYSASFVLILWSGIPSSMLYAYGLFWPNRISPILISLSTIGAVVLFHARSGVLGLGGGALAGSFTVAVLHFHRTRKLSAGLGIERRRWFLPRLHPDLIEGCRISLPVALALLNSQAIGVLLYRVLSLMETGSAALYGYAFKLTHLIYAPGAALATVIFPSLSHTHVTQARNEFRRLLVRAVRMVLFLTVPSAAVLWVLRVPVVTALFGGGALTEAALMRTSNLFGILLIGAPAGALVALLTRTYASLQSNIGTLVASICSLLVVAALLPLSKAYGASGVAAVWSVSAVTNMVVLFAWGTMRGGILPVSETLKYLARLSLVSAVAALSAKTIALSMQDGVLNSGLIPLLHLFGAGALSIAAIFGASFCLRLREVDDIVAFLHWQVRRGQQFLAAL